MQLTLHSFNVGHVELGAPHGEPHLAQELHVPGLHALDRARQRERMVQGEANFGLRK